MTDVRTEFIVDRKLIEQVQGAHLDTIGDSLGVARIVDTLVFEPDHLYRERLLKEFDSPKTQEFAAKAHQARKAVAILVGYMREHSPEGLAILGSPDGIVVIAANGERAEALKHFCFAQRGSQEPTEIS